MTRKQKRLALIGSGLGVLAVAVALILGSLRELDRVLQFADRHRRKQDPGWESVFAWAAW